MARRGVDWNIGLAKDLQDEEFARGFIIAALEEDIPFQIVLGKVIRAMGVKEFSKRAKMASPNVLRAIDPRHNPTQQTLNRLLRPFGLVLTIGPITKNVRKKAA
jgi:DNA-binding phage protein